MEKTTKKVEVAICRTEDGIVITNNLGDEWKFSYTITAFDALALMVSRTMRCQFEKRDYFRKTFKIGVTIE